MKWKTNYGFGIAAVDTQQKLVFDIIYRIYQYENYELNSKHVKQDIRLLINHLRKLHEVEENLMKRQGYSDLERHQLLHTRMISQLSELINYPIKPRMMMTKFRVIAKKLLIHHFVQEDEKLRKHLPPRIEELPAEPIHYFD